MAALAAWRGLTWAGIAILAGLALTVAARLAVDPSIHFVAFGLIWCATGALVAMRGEGAIAALLIASGLCYFGAEISEASAPGCSRWFMASDALGIAAVIVTAVGGDSGLARLHHSIRRLVRSRGNRSYRPYARMAMLAKEKGKGS